ncbi:hypothetical protein DL767_008848 [Monosporascus sp. MG133]|nr:hypothetical protein DL767_008848 [Monosporascus sp. MG133]
MKKSVINIMSKGTDGFQRNRIHVVLGAGLGIGQPLKSTFSVASGHLCSAPRTVWPRPALMGKIRRKALLHNIEEDLQPDDADDEHADDEHKAAE